MKSGILYLTISFALTLSLFQGDLEAASPTEVWNSAGLTGLSYYSAPMMHGMGLVWQAKGGLPNSKSGRNDTEIFYCDLNTFNVIQVTDNEDDDFLPETDGRFIVWQRHTSGGANQIYLYDIEAQGPPDGGPISPLDYQDNYSPKISNGHIVWTSQTVDRAYQPGKIMLYDAIHGTGPTVISNTSADCSDPRIDGNRVLWLQQTTKGGLSQWIYLIDSKHHGPMLAPRHLEFRRSHSSDGTQTVMVRRDGHDGEIFVHNRATGFWQITNNSVEDHSPVISCNHIAWIGNGIIHVADITNTMRVSGLKARRRYRKTFIACWDVLCTDGVDDYRIDLSTTPDFSVCYHGIEDKSVGNVHQYRVKGLKPRTTYYLRIRAVVNGAFTENSDVIRIKTR